MTTGPGNQQYPPHPQWQGPAQWQPGGQSPAPDAPPVPQQPSPVASPSPVAPQPAPVPQAPQGPAPSRWGERPPPVQPGPPYGQPAPPGPPYGQPGPQPDPQWQGSLEWQPGGQQSSAPYPGGQQPPGPPAPRRRRTGLWIALALLAVLVTVGAGIVVGTVLGTAKRSGPSAEETAPADPASVAVTKQDVEALLKGHTAALNDGDLKAYTGIFDQENTALVQQQTRLFNNLRKLPITEMSYRTLAQEGRAQDSFGRGVTFNLDVAFVHRFKGIDLEPVSEWYRWTVSRRAAGAPIVVTKVGGAPAPVGGASRTVYYPGPWDVWSDVSMVRTPHVVMLAPPSLAAKARRIAPIAERAAADDLAFLAKNGRRGRDVPKGFVAALVKGREQLGGLFRKEKAHEAGVSIPMFTWQSSVDALPIGGSRVVVDTASAFFGTVGGIREIFRHEFAHSALASLDGGKAGFLGLDNWMVEGFAEYVANRGSPITADVRYDEGRAYLAGRLSQPFTGRIPDNVSWDAKGMTSVNYLMGHLASRMIAERYGERRLVEFVTASYRDGRSQDAMRKVLGVEEDRFQRQWADYVRGRLG
ncbi:hypothetical protein AB0D67_31865 [Streptosporangium sp. NPDC048047]|uniref:hypothetical protein n=1 Tax=Streptosporangium sp. NPDC048047 TaxID=3155748 RepID=UPI00342EAD09